MFRVAQILYAIGAGRSSFMFTQCGGNRIEVCTLWSSEGRYIPRGASTAVCNPGFPLDFAVVQEIQPMLKLLLHMSITDRCAPPALLYSNQDINEVNALPSGLHSSLATFRITRSTNFHFQHRRHSPNLLGIRRAMWLRNTVSAAVGAPTIPCRAAGERLQLLVPLVDECLF